MARFCDSNQKRGVTLVELIVTIVLIGMVMGLAGIFFNFSFLEHVSSTLLGYLLCTSFHAST